MKRKINYTIVITLISIVVFGQQRNNFTSAFIKIPPNFKRTQFDSVAKFSGAIFYSKADFIYAQFDVEADFSDAQFNSEADFMIADFFSLANFHCTQFDSAARFQGSKFHSEAFFSKAKFHSIAHFSGAEFHSLANFHKVQFDSLADFHKVTFDSIADFDYTFLPQILYFTNVKINGEDIDFTRARVDSIPDKRCHIFLTGTDVTKINLRYEMYKLMFEDSIPFDLKSTIYEKLLKRTEQLGYKKSYAILDKEYKEVTYLEGFEKPKWIRNWIDKNWWGYGYNKELIIRNTILLFLLFSFINSLFFKQLLLKLYEMPKLLELRDKIETKHKIILFIKVFPLAAFYTGFIFFGFNFSFDKLKYNENLQGWRLLNLIYFFTLYLAGIVCLGYLANYVLSS